jgi:hypothetical protein
MIRLNYSLLSLFFLIFLFFGGSKRSIAQIEGTGKIIPFHAYIGNTIDLQEKQKLNLFPEWSDSLFQSAQLVQYDLDRYAILFKTTHYESVEKKISMEERNAIATIIEKEIPPPPVVAKVIEDGSSRTKALKRERISENIDHGAEITIQVLRVVLWVFGQFNPA